MTRKTLIWNFISFSILAGFSQGNDLGSLIVGVTPLEEIKLNGTLLEPESDLITLERDDEGKMSVSYTGPGTLTVTRSTGISIGNAQELLQVAQNALGTRYQLIASIKRGGRLLTISDIEKLNKLMDSSKQKTLVYINNRSVDLDKASVIDSQIDSTVLEPEGHPGIKIIISDSSTSVVTNSEEDEVKIEMTRGLNNKHIEKITENFYGIVAQRASEITGFPKPLLELTVAGREAIVNRLIKILKPTEHITIGENEVDLDKSKRTVTSVGMILQPIDLPKVKITWRKDEKLRVESEDGKAVNVVYSKGVDRSTISRIVNRVHRAITLRLGMISWSNRLLGSIPPQLVSDLEDLKTKIQERNILVNGKEVDLKKASVIETTDDSVLYRLINGDRLRIFFNGAVSTAGDPLTLEYTPGISETQVANLFANINQLFSTSVGFSTDSGETLLNFESNRQLLQSLMRGIKPKEKIRVDEEILEFSNATVSKEDRDLTEYTVENFDDVILTSFTDGDIQVDGKGRNIFISRSTGLSLEFLNKLVLAINNVMPRKRWFYNFGNKGNNQDKGRQLQTVIDEIPNLIQKQTVSIDGKEVDFRKASILSVNNDLIVYTPEANSKVKITRFVNGDIETSSDDGQEVTVKVSQGITSQDADNLISNIKKIVGDRFKIGSKRPGNYWCSTGNMRQLLGWLINAISPKLNILQGDGSYTDEKSSSIRDLSKPNRRNDLIIVDHRGRGKNITSRYGGSFGLDISTGLTQDISEELVQYLVTLLENKEDVIRMITGSISQLKIQKIKGLLKSMIQKKEVQIDSEVLSPSPITSYDPSKRWLIPLNKKKIQLKDDTDGSIQIDSGNNHVVSIAVSPGLTTEQAEQMYRNIKMAFKEKFAEITNVPIQFLDVLSNLKKYFMKSYFFSAAPPKEYILVNGEEIRSKNSSQLGDDKDNFVLDEPDGQTGVRIVKKPDGTLEVISDEGGDIGVIKTTGLEEEHIDRILKAVEAKLGLKNQMFRISTDELFSPPEKYEDLEVLLPSLISTETLKINDAKIDLSRPKRISKNEEGCSLQWFGKGSELVVKKCPNGQISVDYRGGRSVALQVHPGISKQQSNYILKSLMTTIRTKSSNIKHLANYPDTFLHLLADGRIKSLDKIFFLLFPREDIIVDGNRINLEPVELSPDQDYQLNEFETRPGLEIYRYNDGSIQVKSWTGGHLDIHMNSGFTDKLLKYILEKYKDRTSKSLEPYLLVMSEMLNQNASTLLNTIDVVSRYHKSQQPLSGVNITLLMDMVESELKSRIHRLSVNEDLIRNIAEQAVQKQQVFINDQPVNLETSPVEVATNDYITYSPNNIKITKYNNGRIVVECLREETIAVTVSAGIPPKILSSFTDTLSRYIKKMDSDEKFTDRIRAKLVYFVEALYETATKGIDNHQRITLNDEEVQLSDDLLLKDTLDSKIYKKDDLVISLDAEGGTEVEMMSPGKLELDISSGVLTEPMIKFIYDNSLQLLNEAYQSILHFETVVPIMTKLEKIIYQLLDSLQQKILINGKDINSPAMQIVEASKDLKILKDKHTDGLQITAFKDGKLLINNVNPNIAVKVSVSSGLSPADQEKLSNNIELLFSRFNPVELVADFMDILPKNFFILAQNMDRVLSIINLIQF